MKATVVIPARMASQRFPGKPLAKILGKPMIEHVYQRSLLIPGADDVVVATDDSEIQKVVLAFGGRVVMTSPHHPSGSDRLAETADILNLAAEDLVLNIQGDQPAFDPEQAAQLIEPLRQEPSLEMATLALPLTDKEDILNPDHVKVAFNSQHYALYFSRAPIPWPRDGGDGAYYKHIGVYAYRAAFLRQFVKWPEGRLECVERLEQLRALENGARIKIILAQGLSPEVDRPLDIARAEEALRQSVD